MGGIDESLWSDVDFCRENKVLWSSHFASYIFLVLIFQVLWSLIFCLLHLLILDLWKCWLWSSHFLVLIFKGVFWNLNYLWFQRVHDNNVLVVDVVCFVQDTCKKSCMGFCKWERVKHGGHPPYYSLGFYLTSLPKLWPRGHSKLPKWQDSLTCFLAIIFLIIWWSEVYVNLPIKIYF